jgi:tetratricopeptide (TPR) repeat protein
LLNFIWAIDERGNTYRVMEKYEKAIEDFNQVIEIDSNNAQAIAHRGQSYFRLQRYQEAIADFNRAIEIEPTLV